MSDPAGELRAALEPWIRSDAGVIAAFAGQTVKVFATLPPVNAVPPYIFIAGLFVRDDIAECMDAAEVDLQIDVWSLTSPPGFVEAERIAKAVKILLAALEDDGDSPAFTVAGYRIVSVQPISTNYLTDPSDGKTVHAVVQLTLTVDTVD
jgi:hypothetical protein